MKNARTAIAAVLAALVVAGAVAEVGTAAPKKRGGVYASPAEARKAGPDFDIQGEYVGTIGGKADQKVGVQVIALGGGAFQAVFLPGGLPGAGWDAKSKILCDGKLDGNAVLFAPAKGSKKYMGGPPAQFSATKEFPPKGQKDYTARIEGGKLTGKTDTGEAIEAKKIERKSPTLGAKPPAVATVLLPYEAGKKSSLAAWANANWALMDCGCAKVSKGGNSTKEKFGGRWMLHVEFRSPFQPTARSQGRGNSGVFPPGGREVQVLDSFGLEGLPNEAGGIYKSHSSKVNMCLPPLSWQTYDIEYRPAGADADGKAVNASYKVTHNGVVIHEKVDLGKSRTGSLNLQDHGNPVSYRNIWIVLHKDEKAAK